MVTRAQTKETSKTPRKRSRGNDAKERSRATNSGNDGAKEPELMLTWEVLRSVYPTHTFHMEDNLVYRDIVATRNIIAQVGTTDEGQEAANSEMLVRSRDRAFAALSPAAGSWRHACVDRLGFSARVQFGHSNRNCSRSFECDTYLCELAVGSTIPSTSIKSNYTPVVVSPPRKKKGKNIRTSCKDRKMHAANEASNR